MRLVGAEERALWAGAVVKATIPPETPRGPQTPEEAMTAAAAVEQAVNAATAVADRIVLEFRARDGSRS